MEGVSLWQISIYNFLKTFIGYLTPLQCTALDIKKEVSELLVVGFLLPQLTNYYVKLPARREIYILKTSVRTVNDNGA